MFYDAISESLHLGKQAAMGKKQLNDFYNASISALMKVHVPIYGHVVFTLPFVILMI